MLAERVINTQVYAHPTMILLNALKREGVQTPDPDLNYWQTIFLSQIVVFFLAIYVS